jgi:hypothetical protein
MSFLIPVIFFHKMEIITTKTPVSPVCTKPGVVPNDDSTVHFCRDYDSRKNTATDRNLACEGAFLV